MTDNETAFMHDLYILFKKHNINKCVVKENRIIFISKDNTLSFFSYSFGTFYEIATNTSKFTPLYGEEGE